VFLKNISDFTAIFQQLYLVVRMELLWNRRVRTVFLKVEKSIVPYDSLNKQKQWRLYV